MRVKYAKCANKTPLNGLKLKTESIRTLRRKLKQEINDSDNDESDKEDNQIVLNDNHEPEPMFTQQSATQPLNNITNNSETQAQSSCTQLPGGRGRGRPTNAEKALRLEKELQMSKPVPIHSSQRLKK